MPPREHQGMPPKCPLLSRVFINPPGSWDCPAKIGTIGNYSNRAGSVEWLLQNTKWERLREKKNNTKHKKKLQSLESGWSFFSHPNLQKYGSSLTLQNCLHRELKRVKGRRNLKKNSKKVKPKIMTLGGDPCETTAAKTKISSQPKTFLASKFGEGNLKKNLHFFKIFSKWQPPFFK